MASALSAPAAVALQVPASAIAAAVVAAAAAAPGASAAADGGGGGVAVAGPVVASAVPSGCPAALPPRPPEVFYRISYNTPLASPNLQPWPS
jgi:hypothetical protein